MYNRPLETQNFKTPYEPINLPRQNTIKIQYGNQKAEQPHDWAQNAKQQLIDHVQKNTRELLAPSEPMGAPSEKASEDPQAAEQARIKEELDELVEKLGKKCGQANSTERRGATEEAQKKEKPSKQEQGMPSKPQPMFPLR